MSHGLDSGSMERQRQRAVLAARMTPAQRFAFEWPAAHLDAATDGRFTRALDDKPGDRAWHVTLFVNAAPGLPEAWPAWFALAKWGMAKEGLLRFRDMTFTADGEGRAESGVSLLDWPNMRFRRARELLIRELRGVGVPERLTFWPENKVELVAHAGALKLDPKKQLGFSAWLPLTEAEALAALPPRTLTAIAPDYMKARAETDAARILEEMN